MITGGVELSPFTRIFLFSWLISVPYDFKVISRESVRNCNSLSEPAMRSISSANLKLLIFLPSIAILDD